MNYSVLVLAAGKGNGMGLGYNKMFYTLEDGETIIQHTLKIFLNDARCKQIIVATSSSDMHKMVTLTSLGKIMMVNGGKRRQDSVMNGLMAVKEDVVLIHDGSRPYLQKESIDLILEEMEYEKACILAIKINDTIKHVSNGYIEKTVNRDEHMLAQTPQAFNTSFIIDCYSKAYALNIEVTDDAQIVESVSDVKVKIVKGSPKNKKITTKEDIQ